MKLVVQDGGRGVLLDLLYDKIPKRAILVGMRRDRWAHQFATPVNLAAHSLLVRDCLMEIGEPSPMMQAAALTHDMVESLLGEHARGLKRRMRFLLPEIDPEPLTLDAVEVEMLPLFLQAMTHLDEETCEKVAAFTLEPLIKSADDLAAYIEATTLGPLVFDDLASTWWPEQIQWCAANLGASKRLRGKIKSYCGSGMRDPMDLRAQVYNSPYSLAQCPQDRFAYTTSQTIYRWEDALRAIQEKL